MPFCFACLYVSRWNNATSQSYDFAALCLSYVVIKGICFAAAELQISDFLHVTCVIYVLSPEKGHGVFCRICAEFFRSSLKHKTLQNRPLFRTGTEPNPNRTNQTRTHFYKEPNRTKTDDNKNYVELESNPTHKTWRTRTEPCGLGSCQFSKFVD